MANATNYIILAIFAVIVIYYFLATAYDVASPNVAAEAIEFAVNNTNYATANSPIVYVRSISNATDTIPAGNFSYTTTQIKLVLTDESYAVGTYNVNYDYEAPATVWGLDLGFMGFLVALGITGALLLKLLFKK